jgi:hypothetical protein
VRRIGMLMPLDENDPVMKARVSEFTQALADLGWTVDRNVRIDLRWGGGDIPALAQELAGLRPDIILANGGVATVALQRETRTIPIVFVNLLDPIANGIVPRLDRPGGNTTGFANLEGSIGGKWLELLSETLAFKGCGLCPRELHVRSCCDAHSMSGAGQLPPPNHVRDGGSFRRKRPWRPRQHARQACGRWMCRTGSATLGDHERGCIAGSRAGPEVVAPPFKHSTRLVT